MTVQYKPPHRLTVENLRMGLHPKVDFRNDVVEREKIPTDETEKLKYNEEQIIGAALAQEYNVVIWDGLEVSYVTIGLALAFLHIPQDDPGTLLYCVREPNMEIDGDFNDDESYRQPVTAIARFLCFSLMSGLSSILDNAWRTQAMNQLNTWATTIDFVRPQKPDEELQQAPPGSEYKRSPHTTTESTSCVWQPSSMQISYLGQEVWGLVEVAQAETTQCIFTHSSACLDFNRMEILMTITLMWSCARQSRNNERHPITAEDIV